MRLRIGTRNSRLALIQTERAAERLRALLPGLSFHIVPLSSPGDRDRETDLRDSPADFFTRDLDQALFGGEMDLALHSAKDVPDPVPEGLDWFWLPWREDARDVIVAASSRQVGDLPENPRIGVSSERREVYCRERFPRATLTPIRGNIDDRLRQVDEGRFDLVVMAAAALQRLGLTHRITEWISLDDLPPPAGQGALAVTFRANDACLLRLRSLFVKTATFVGAGVGSADLCTLSGTKALNRCEVCLHDALLDPALLDELPADAARIDVGKRSGAHSREQPEINALLARYVRRGLRVVRLKGGDPGIFGRLAEEIETLESLHLPYRVIPGVSSLSAATTGTGMLLTRRGVSRGFSVISAREKGGKTADVSAPARAALPCVFFMAAGVADGIVAQLLADGLPADTPAAIVYNAGADNETILRALLVDIARLNTEHRATNADSPPGLFVVGETARSTLNRDHGALRGKRVLLTCSAALLDRAAEAVHDLGGQPVRFPLVRIAPAPDAEKALEHLGRYDWVVLTSPSAVRVLFDILMKSETDLRVLPRIMVSGPATARELARHGLMADLCPEADFGGKGMLAAARSSLSAGTKILRLRSNRAGPDLARALRDMGADVDDKILYRSEAISHDTLCAFDMAFFASSSAVKAFMDRWGAAGFRGKLVAAIGPPTAETLKEAGIREVVVPDAATVEDAVLALASRLVAHSIEETHS